MILYQNAATSINHDGFPDKAIELCSRAIKINCNSWKAWFQIGLACSKKGDYEGAIKNIKKAIELDPSNKNLRVEYEKVKAEKKQIGVNQ